MYGELGRIPLIVQRYIRIVKYWLKFLNIKQTRLTQVLYDVQFNANNHTIVNWVSKVRNLLCSYGFGEAWYNQGVGDVNLFLVLSKQRAIDLYLHDWFLNLENTNKALLYRNIKVYFRPSVYLTVISNIQHRLALTQLRTHVETGSWCKPRSTPSMFYLWPGWTGRRIPFCIMLSCIHSTKIKIYKKVLLSIP